MFATPREVSEISTPLTVIPCIPIIFIFAFDTEGADCDQVVLLRGLHRQLLSLSRSTSPSRTTLRPLEPLKCLGKSRCLYREGQALVTPRS